MSYTAIDTALKKQGVPIPLLQFCYVLYIVLTARAATISEDLIVSVSLLKRASAILDNTQCYRTVVLAHRHATAWLMQYSHCWWAHSDDGLFPTRVNKGTDYTIVRSSALPIKLLQCREKWFKTNKQTNKQTNKHTNKRDTMFSWARPLSSNQRSSSYQEAHDH